MSDSQSVTPPPPAAPAVPKRRSPVGWTVFGILLLLVSLGSWPRGLLGIVMSDNPAYYLGVFVFGAALVAVGIVLLVRASKIRAENRALDAAAVTGTAPAAPTPPPAS